MGYSGLPSALWHIGLGWLDIGTDIASIVVTHNIARKAEVTCGVDFRTYFIVCFYVQLGLLVGNQVTQMILAAMEAAKAAKPGQPHRARIICFAMLRGATNCQLAYQELLKHKNPTPQHTMTILHHKMGELIWEAPQVIIGWSILLIRMVYQDMEDLHAGTNKGFGSWMVLPAATVSFFINIPWVTGRTMKFCVGRFSCWPSWVMQCTYLVGPTILCILTTSWFGGGGQIQPPGVIARENCLKYPGYISNEQLYSEYSKLPTCTTSRRASYTPTLTYNLLVFVAPLCALVADLVLFMALAGWHSDRRRRYLHKHKGVSLEQMVHDLDIGIDQLPSASYAWRGLMAVRIDVLDEPLRA